MTWNILLILGEYLSKHQPLTNFLLILLKFHFGKHKVQQIIVVVVE